MVMPTARTAGSWQHKDFPAPVGMHTKTSFSPAKTTEESSRPLSGVEFLGLGLEGWAETAHVCMYQVAQQQNTSVQVLKAQQYFACQQWFPSNNLRLLCKHLEAAVQKYQKIHRNPDKEKLRISSRKTASANFTDLHSPHYQPHDRTSPHPLKAYPRKAPHMKQELEISTTLIISCSE